LGWLEYTKKAIVCQGISIRVWQDRDRTKSSITG
jgi:hypothetical protein